ncbi:hypothetical protein ACFDTO_32870 [Microbacteriaceae bacterium 4G12]
MSKTTWRMLPFVFPLLTIFVFMVGVGPYTPHIGGALLLIGFLYSLYDMFIQKKAVVAAIINVYLITAIVLTGGILFVFMIISGV